MLTESRFKCRTCFVCLWSIAFIGQFLRLLLKRNSNSGFFEYFRRLRSYIECNESSAALTLKRCVCRAFEHFLHSNYSITKFLQIKTDSDIFVTFFLIPSQVDLSLSCQFQLLLTLIVNYWSYHMPSYELHIHVLQSIFSAFYYYFFFLLRRFQLFFHHFDLNLIEFITHIFKEKLVIAKVSVYHAKPSCSP